MFCTLIAKELIFILFFLYPSALFTFQINLRHGVPPDCINETCTSGAGTLVLEFGILSRLLGDPVYESLARRAVQMLWKYRSNVTGLFGQFNLDSMPCSRPSAI